MTAAQVNIFCMASRKSINLLNGPPQKLGEALQLFNILPVIVKDTVQ